MFYNLWRESCSPDQFYENFLVMINFFPLWRESTHHNILCAEKQIQARYRYSLGPDTPTVKSREFFKSSMTAKYVAYRDICTPLRYCSFGKIFIVKMSDRFFNFSSFCRIEESVKSVDTYITKCNRIDCSSLPEFIRLVGKVAGSTLRHLKTGNGSHLDRYVRRTMTVSLVLQSGPDTGKTGNLDVHFSRQGKHGEFVQKYKKYILHMEFAPTRKILKL